MNELGKGNALSLPQIPSRHRLHLIMLDATQATTPTEAENQMWLTTRHAI